MLRSPVGSPAIGRRWALASGPAGRDACRRWTPSGWPRSAPRTICFLLRLAGGGVAGEPRLHAASSSAFCSPRAMRGAAAHARDRRRGRLSLARPRLRVALVLHVVRASRSRSSCSRRESSGCSTSWPVSTLVWALRRRHCRHERARARRSWRRSHRRCCPWAAGPIS